jgi:APA family basic amino acid/polyamine antiporter
MQSEQRLQARLSARDGAAIVVSNVIGGGIFFTPIVIAQLVPHPGAMLAAWFVGGLLAFCGAMAYAELAALRPQAGGEYVYLRDAFGPLAAFLTGWTSFVAGFSGALAAGALAFARYLGRFIPAAASADPLLTVPLPLIPLVVSPQSLVAIALLGILSFIHYRGLGIGRVVQNGLTVLKVGFLIALIVTGFAFGQGSVAHFSHDAEISWRNWIFALVPVMFSYSGWNAAAYVAEETRDPARAVPRALAMGTAAVVAIYLGLNALYVFAIPVAEIGALKGGILDVTGERLFALPLANLFAAFTLVSIAASLSAMIIAGPRVSYAMAQDGLFFDAAARGYPVAPAFFVVSSLLIVLNDLWSQPGPALAGLLVIGAGVPLYWLLRRRAQ